MPKAHRKFTAWLCAASMLTPSLLVPFSAAEAQVRATPGTAQRTSTFSCPNNRFTNGDFSNVTGQVDARGDQDIDLAVGWLAPWGSGSLADLYSSTAQAGAGTMNNADGNYASMWIGNRNETDTTYREGMYNRLATPIAANSGSHVFTFKTYNLYPTGTGSSWIGVYGVRRVAGDPPASAPSGHSTPSNLNLFGAGKVVHLATIEIPAGAPRNAWQQQSVTFSTANWGALPEITHVMVTKADPTDGAATGTQRSYMAFDDFCMRSSVETGGVNTDPGGGGTSGGATGGTGGPGGIGQQNTNCPGAGCTDVSYSTCCPPLSSARLSSMLSVVQPNIGGDYYLHFTLDPAVDAQMVAYGAYLKLLDPSYTGMAMTIRAFDGGSGATPIISGGPLEPEKAIYWNPGSPSGAQWPAGDLFSAATARPVNNWTVVETVIWHSGPNRPWSLDCSIKRIAYRPQIVGGRAMPGNRGFVDYAGAAPSSAARRPAARPGGR